MRYKITCHCVRCGHKWARITKDPDSPDPPCPNLACGETPVTIGMDLSSNKAPAAIGGNISVKAIDETAKIVMQDYGMTDLRSDVREGESAAPKLPPRQQQQADNYFGGGAGRRPMRGFNPAAHAAAAMRGQLSDAGSTNRSIGAAHANRLRPPVHLIENKP
jgi:hypothetical protein